jgi:hypothetical protein
MGATAADHRNATPEAAGALQPAALPTWKAHSSSWCSKAGSDALAEAALVAIVCKHTAKQSQVSNKGFWQSIEAGERPDAHVVLPFDSLPSC